MRFDWAIKRCYNILVTNPYQKALTSQSLLSFPLDIKDGLNDSFPNVCHPMSWFTGSSTFNRGAQAVNSVGPMSCGVVSTTHKVWAHKVPVTGDHGLAGCYLIH